MMILASLLGSCRKSRIPETSIILNEEETDSDVITTTEQIRDDKDVSGVYEETYVVEDEDDVYDPIPYTYFKEVGSSA